MFIQVSLNFLLILFCFYLISHMCRFPHLSFCACEVSCSISIKEIALVEVHPGIFVGNFVHGLGVKKVKYKQIRIERSILFNMVFSWFRCS